MSDETISLEPVDTEPEAILDHPEGVTEYESNFGLEMYRAIDDLDDESNGLPR